MKTNKQKCVNEDCQYWESNAKTLCELCTESGWKLKNGNVVQPKPEKGRKYYSGWPLYRCHICGLKGGH